MGFSLRLLLGHLPDAPVDLLPQQLGASRRPVRGWAVRHPEGVGRDEEEDGRRSVEDMCFLVGVL